MTLTLTDLAAIAGIAGAVMTAGLGVIRLMIRVHVADALRDFDTEIRAALGKLDARIDRIVERKAS